MHINSITNILNYRYNFNKNNQKKNPQYENCSNLMTKPFADMVVYPIPFLGTPRIAKDMATFYPRNETKMPKRLKNYLDSVEDKFILTPLEAMRNAYADLLETKNVKEVKLLFPDEDLFQNLIPLKESNSRRGILKVYKEFKELFDNSILKNGDDFVVYILRKIFYDTKLLDEINKDLDNDLHPDIKIEFKRRNKDKDRDYIDGELLKDLGIYFPDRDFWNSLKFTREGYSDSFGEKVSKALRERWDKLTDEQKQAEVIKRCKGLEEWWNSLTDEQQMNLAIGIDYNDEAYKDYKQYAKAHFIKEKENITKVPEYERNQPKKKIKTDITLRNIDAFNLWMHSNLEKFYESKTDEEKEIINIRRSQAQARFWKDMTPEARIDFINKIKNGIEPIRYAMIDTWNHSLILIRTLSEYLKEKQLLVPPNTFYDSSVFIRFQSKIMTEFWAQNRDLAEKFGNRLAYSHQIVENSIKNGTFEELKKQITNEQKERIKNLEKEYQEEANSKIETEWKPLERKEIEDIINRVEKKDITANKAAISIDDANYKKEFTQLYIKSMDKYHLLPPAYTNEMAEIFLDRFPKDIVIKYGNALKRNEPIPQDVMDYIISEQEKNNSPRLERIQRALENAIAVEMTSKGANPILFKMNVNELISILNHRYTDITVPKGKKIDPGKIARLYKEYDRDLSDNAANTLANTYFAATREITEEENNLFSNYINSYGRSLLILFSDKSAYSDTIKDSFNEKFLKLMPNKIKEYIHFYIKTIEDIREENTISDITTQIYKRFKYIPDDILKIYTREIANAIRLDRETHKDNTLKNFKNTFYKQTGLEKGQSFPGFEKDLLQQEEKFKILALEQAMADEFYKVTKSNDIFSRDYETLLNFYDMVSILQPHKSMTLHKDDGSIIYTVNDKPNTHIIRAKYLDYLNKIKSNKNINNPDGTINKNELLHCLSPKADNVEKDLGIIKKINEYFPDQKEQIQIIKDKAENQKAEPSILNTEAGTISSNDEYKKDFRIEFARTFNKRNILPSKYVKELGEIILETLPKETIEEYINNAFSRNMFTNEAIRSKCSKENLKKLNRIQHALEAAIAAELVAKGGDISLYGESVDTLIPELEKQELGAGLKKQFKIDTDNIQDKYNYYKKDLSQSDIIYIINNYFLTDNPTPELEKKTMEFLNEYGKTLEILFSVDISLPLSIKEAFNKKFLNSMPQDIKDNVTPLLKTREDFKTNHDIEIVRRQLTKRFDSVIPQEPLNIYTREAARMMRLMEQPDADPELKRDYNIEQFKKSISKEEDKINGNLSSVLTLPKYCITNDASKIHLLAIEQAIADELYRVSNKKDIIYQYDLEELALWFEIGSSISKDNKQGIEINNEDNDDGFVIKSKPNKSNLVQKYIKYMKNFNESEDLYLKNGELNREEILFCLNPDENLKDRDKYTKARIDKYFAED